MSDRMPAWLRNLVTMRLALVDEAANPAADVLLYKAKARPKWCPECRGVMPDQAVYCAECGWTTKPTSEIEKGKTTMSTDAKHFADLIQEAKRASLLSGTDFNEPDFIAKAAELFPEEARAWSDAAATEVTKGATPAPSLPTTSAFEKLEKVAEQIRKDRPELSPQQAIDAAHGIAPDLVAEHQAEIRASV